MILIENLNFLTERFPLLWQAIRPLEKKEFPNLEITAAKNGSPTLMVEREGKFLYLHSSYNPEAEAERLIAQFTEIEKYRHVFFFGVGLGYHIEAFMRKYPTLEFTIYEPVPEILSTYLATRQLINLPTKQLKNFYVETSPVNRPLLLKDFIENTKENVLFVILPSYERAFPETSQAFIESFQRMLATKRYSLRATKAYQHKWTINSIKNLKYLLQTPNILKERGRFKGIPALIVAAGPSLLDEIENIRLIKEKGLAYIFSAGSGLVPLLNNGIYPDAATSYDPNNFDGVYKQIIEQKITSIPLIFGSTVGISLQKYPGSMAHMINSQDMIAPYYLCLKNGEKIQTFYDSPTISVVLVQLLKHLGFEPLIFVGQNLAFRGEYRYADGIPYYKAELTDYWRKKAIPVESVDGKEIYTTEEFNFMRFELQRAVSLYRDDVFINTTKGGAKIEGTIFMPLSQVIAEHLTERVVNPTWFPTATCDYDLSYFSKQQKMMDADFKEITLIITGLEKAFKALESLKSSANSEQWERQIERFNRQLKKLNRNKFYKVFISPGKQVELEMIAKNLDEVRFEADQRARGEKIIKLFGGLINSLPESVEILVKQYDYLQRMITEVGNTSKGGDC